MIYICEEKEKKRKYVYMKSDIYYVAVNERNTEQSYVWILLLNINNHVCY